MGVVAAVEGLVKAAGEGLGAVEKAAELAGAGEKVGEALGPAELVHVFNAAADHTLEVTTHAGTPLVQIWAPEASAMNIGDVTGDLTLLDKEAAGLTRMFKKDIKLLAAGPDASVTQGAQAAGAGQAETASAKPINTGTEAKAENPFDLSNVRLKGEAWETDMPEATRKMLQDDPEVISQATDSHYEETTEKHSERTANLKDLLSTLRTPMDEADTDRLTKILGSPEAENLLEQLDTLVNTKLNDSEREALKRLAIHALIKGAGELSAFMLEQIADVDNGEFGNMLRSTAKKARATSNMVAQIYTGQNKPSLTKDFVNYARLKYGKEEVAADAQLEAES